MTGSIQVRALKTGRRYDAVRRANGKQKRKASDKRKEAERYLAIMAKAAHEGACLDVRLWPWRRGLTAG